MTNWKTVANALVRELDLESPPVQLSYLDQAPTGVPEHPGGAPSVCTFFAEGKDRGFFADTKAHEACEVGAFVMGIAPHGELGGRLTSTIGKMTNGGYLEPGEAAKVPHNPTAPKFVAYGPLGSLPVPPTTVLMFAKPRSAMFALEAAHFQAPLNGRPMCAIVPTLQAGAPVAISMGCIGSRVYTQMGDDRMVVGVRGDHLERFVEELKRIRHANQAVESEDRQRRAKSKHPYHQKRSTIRLPDLS